MLAQRTESYLADWLSKKPHLLKRDWSCFRQPKLTAQLARDVEDIMEFYEFTPTDDVAISCGIRKYYDMHESRFILRLLQLRKETGAVAYIQFGKEVYQILADKVADIREMIYSQRDSLIIKNDDLWIYVAKGVGTDNYFLHIRDTKRAKISLDATQLDGIVSFKDKIIYEYKRFQVRRYQWMQEILATVQ